MMYFEAIQDNVWNNIATSVYNIVNFRESGTLFSSFYKKEKAAWKV